MSNLEKWVNAILNDKISIGSIRTLSMIKDEILRLQSENNKLRGEALILEEQINAERTRHEQYEISVSKIFEKMEALIKSINKP